MNDYEDNHEPIELEIDGTLDLHAFSPKDLKILIPDYIEECLRRDITHLRIIHGKGIGNIRRSVHAILNRSPFVASFKLAGEDGGAWGATLVTLHRRG